MSNAWGYDPNAKVANEGGGKAPPGDYRYRVESVEPTTFKTGSRGYTITLTVDANGRGIKCFDRLVLVPKALWKVEQFMQSLGFDFLNPPPPQAAVGKVGRAKFVSGEKGYLEVSEYYPAQANSGFPAPPQQTPQPQQGALDPNPPDWLKDGGASSNDNLPF